MWHEPQFPPPSLGLVIKSSGAHTKHATPCTNAKNRLGLHLSLWTTWLQQQPLCTTQVQSLSSRCPWNLQDLGTTYRKRILYWQFHGTLPLPQCLHPWYKRHMRLQHCLFQAQISCNANFDTIRWVNQGCRHPIRSNHRCNTCLKHHKWCHHTTAQHIQAKSQQCQNATSAQRVLTQRAQSQRVHTEQSNTFPQPDIPTQADKLWMDLIESQPEFPPLEIEERIP